MNAYFHRLRPFVEATRPGHPDDSETKAFETRMQKEAEDLKFESFGVEVCLILSALFSSIDPLQLLHTIGNVYMMKATSFMKSRKFLGIPGFFSRLKEKGTLAKDAWGVIGSALGVQASIEVSKYPCNDRMMFPLNCVVAISKWRVYRKRVRSLKSRCAISKTT